MVGIVAFYLRVSDVENPVELRERINGARGNAPTTIFVENRRGALLPINVALFALGGRIWITRDGSIHIGDVTLKAGSNVPRISGKGVSEGPFSYFGSKRSVAGLPMYRSVLFRSIDDGVDMVLNGLKDGTLEYYLKIEPGVSPEKVIFTVKGARIRKTSEGGLHVVKNGKLILSMHPPRAYQGSREVDVEFVVHSDSTFGFRVGSYDKRFPLVIDPTAIIASPLEDKVTDIHVDPDGNVYVTGWTVDYFNFVPSNTFGSPTRSVRSAFVVKLSPDLSTVLAAAIVAGSDQDYGWAVRTDANGNVYLGGSTKSTDFAPTRVVFGTSGSGKYQWFIAKLTPDLSSHVRTVLISGSDHDLFRDFEIRNDGTIYATGYTYNYADFAPSRNVFGTCASIEGVVVKLDTSLSSFGQAAVVCGDISEGFYGLTLFGSDVLLAGISNSYYYAPTRYIYGSIGNWNAVVTRLSGDLSTHVASAVITSYDYDAVYEVKVGSDGNPIVVGITLAGDNVSTSRNVIGTTGGFDIFLTKLSPDLSSHISTLVIASPDTEVVYLKTSHMKGDTLMVLINTQNASDLAGTDCVPCNISSGGGPWDAVVVGVTTDLSTCVGKSTFTASGDEGAYVLTARGENLLAGGPLISYTLSEYPSPQYEHGYSGDIDGYVISGRPRCLVNVDEYPGTSEPPMVITKVGEISISLPHPSYVGYDLISPDGRVVQRVSVGYLQSGKYSWIVNAPSGIYMVRIRIGEKVYSGKVVIR